MELARTERCQDRASIPGRMTSNARLPLSNLHLDSEERAMLAGEAGEAVRLAMRILVRLAPLYEADHLLPVTRAHIDGCIYEGDAGLEFAERLATAGGAVRVPTTLNVGSLDRARWREHGMASAFADKARRLGDAYLAMGAQPTFTCAPYQNGVDLAPGEQIAWAESNAVAYANTVKGARTNRYGDYLDISCALTGRVPAAGLHLDGPRQATVEIRLAGVPGELQRRDDFWPVLGYLIGKQVDEEVPAITGIDVQPTGDQLKAFCAAAATSGSVALAHIVGVTPEAPSLADCTLPSPRRITLDLADLRAARAELTTLTGTAIDLVAFGSPHCSLTECRELARLMAGRRAAASVQVWITTSRAVRALLERGGELATLEAFGAIVTADTCIVVAPLVRQGSRALMTNSGKYAHYAPGLLGVQSAFGSTAECVESAVAGRIVREGSPWQTGS